MQVCIVCGAGFASRRCLQVSSNVRLQRNNSTCNRGNTLNVQSLFAVVTVVAVFAVVASAWFAWFEGFNSAAGERSQKLGTLGLFMRVAKNEHDFRK